MNFLFFHLKWTILVIEGVESLGKNMVFPLQIEKLSDKYDEFFIGEK